MSSVSVTDVTETTVVAAATSTLVVTTTSTSTSDSFTSTITSESTSSSVISVSSIFITPSTTFVPAPTTQPSVVAVTSTIIQSPASTGGTQAPSVVVITSTAPPASTAIITTPSTAASSTSSPSALSASGSGSGSSSKSGLSTGGTIAIAVVIPIVAIAALFLLGLFFWRRRKERKVAEEQRKAEIEDYGLNPNQDPTLATAAYPETGPEMAEDNNGYRGWGTTTSAQRNPSTTLGSGSRGATGAAGAAAAAGMSETSSTQGGNAYTQSPSDETHRGEGIAAGALAGGAMGVAASRRRSNEPSNIRRGPSNASSAYSAGPAHTDALEELPGSGAPAPYYHEEGPYNYIDAQAQQGPYGDGTYHPSGQPVIRNNPARRNTRIDRAPTYPNVGIAQNF